MRHVVVRSLMVTTAAFVAMTLSAASPALKSPDLVKNALRILAYVQADMASKLPSKSYNRLPHENEEFQEAAVPMRESVANEPAELKAQVDALLKIAQAKANAVAEISKTNDEALIKPAIDAVAAALKPLNELFPVELRPIAGQLGRGPGGPPGGGPPGGGPPPDLR